MLLTGSMNESGSESASDKERKNDSSGSGSGSESDSGSSASSGSGSDRSGSAKSAAERSNHSDDTKSSRKHSNANSSKSDHHTDRISSDDYSPKSKPRNNHGEKVKADLWEDNPDIYGIRRSARSRKEPDRLRIAAENSDSSERGRNHSRKSRKRSDSWNSNSSESDSDLKGSPPPPSKRPGQRSVPLRKKKPSRRRKFLSDDDESTEGSDDDGRRQATRRAGAAVSYKEASDEQTDSSDLLEVDGDAEAEAEAEPEDNSETIERVLGNRRGKKGVTGNVTTVYYIEENGDLNEGCNPDDEETTEPQYLIKWKGWSHIHNTWESERSLAEQKVKGIKKLENYMKKEAELAWWRKQAGPEDIDYYECQSELQLELVKTYNFVERIIAEQTRELEGGEPVREYFCKWESLPYADATWEDSVLIERRWPQEVEHFKYREAAKTTPTRHCPVLRRRPKFHQLKEQPEYMGKDQSFILRDYQMDGLNWMIHSWCKDNSVILADEMGLGKTIQTICFLYYLFKSQQLYGPFLCVVPLSTMTAWQREFVQWAPDINVVTYLGDVSSRDIIRSFEWSFASSKRLKFNAILTTYEILLKDRQFLRSFSWACLLVDEAHRLKNDDSLLYKALKEFDTNHRLLVTGTPLQNSLKELWALLHFIMPNRFESWEDFEKDHEDAAVKGYEKLHKQLEPFILRRQKKDVEKSLPAKVEQILRVEMTTIQKQYYKWILTKNYSALRKGVKGSINTFINIVIELKKCCNHALLTKPEDYESRASLATTDAVEKLLRGSGKLLLLDKLLCRLKETGHRVLIFSQMVRMLDILAEYLQRRHFPFQRLDGSIKGEIRKQALDHFNAEGSQDFCFLLSTRAGGLGINLATADTVIIFDSDWNPQNDLQAQARAHRIGQKNQVNIYRLVTARSVEEDIVERAKRKMVLDHLVIQRMDTTGRTVLNKRDGTPGTTANNPFNKEDLNAILKFGAEELFKDDDENEEEPVCDIDEILQRAETRDEGPTMVGDELLSAFKVASFAFDEDKAVMEVKKENVEEESKDWDDIIPENVRKTIAEQEKSKEMEDLYLPPRRKNLQQNDADKGGRKRRGRGSADGQDGDAADGEGEADSDYSEGDGSEGDDRPKKRGRPPASYREKIKGFTDHEIRRFVKSYKKFSAPIKHLDSIACDAELQEKPLAELKKLGEVLEERCKSVLNDTSEAHTETNEAGRKNTIKKFKLGGVPVNAKTLSSALAELAPLDVFLPDTKEDRLKWQLDFRTRPANFDIEWGVPDDSKLLAGIYQYGMGSWEAIKMDSSFEISDKILTNEDKKPQAKHLQSRAEYLLKVIKKLLDQKNGKQKQRKPRGRRGNKEPVTKDIVEDEISSADEKKNKTKAEKGKLKPEDISTHDETSNDKTIKEKKRSKKDGKDRNNSKTKGRKKPVGPMHFTANNEPRALEVLGDLDPSVFEECKEKMRPVKKALRSLDNPDQTLSESDQVSRTRACLAQIGAQIDICLEVYPDPDKKAEWRSNLWYFVSKFTNFDAKQLYRLYKYGLKKPDGPKKSGKHKKENVKNNKNNHDTNNHEKSSKKEKRDEGNENKIKKARTDKANNIKNPYTSGVKRKLEDGECDPEPSENKRHERRKHKHKDRKGREKSPLKTDDLMYRERSRSERERDRERDRDRDRERDRERDRDRDQKRDRDRDRERSRPRRDSGGLGTPRSRPAYGMPHPHPDHPTHPAWTPPAYPGPRQYRGDRADRTSRQHDKRSRYGVPAYPAGMTSSTYAAYYDSATAMASGMVFPPARPYTDEWRGYTQPEGYSYDERDYEREVYRRDYDRRAPPT